MELEDFVSEVGLHFIYQYHLLEINVNEKTVIDQKHCILCTAFTTCNSEIQYN